MGPYAEDHKLKQPLNDYIKERDEHEASHVTQTPTEFYAEGPI